MTTCTITSGDKSVTLDAGALARLDGRTRVDPAPPKETGGVASEQLLSFIDRIEHQEEEKRDILEAIKEIYSEAKGQGFDVPAIKRVVALCRKSAEDRREEEELVKLYKSALELE